MKIIGVLKTKREWKGDFIVVLKNIKYNLKLT